MKLVELDTQDQDGVSYGEKLAVCTKMVGHSFCFGGVIDFFLS